MAGILDIHGLSLLMKCLRSLKLKNSAVF